MQALNLNDLDLIRAWSSKDPSADLHFNFPVYSATGAMSTSVVYMELEPGCHLGRHTDSAEEIVVVLEGTVRGTVGDETGELTAGGIVLIPAMVPHDLLNTGTTKARAVGIFSSSTVVSTFDHALQPIGRRVVGTPLPPEETPAAIGA